MKKFLGLKFVPKYGWSKGALRAGASELGYPPTYSSIIKNV